MKELFKELGYVISHFTHLVAFSIVQEGETSMCARTYRIYIELRKQMWSCLGLGVRVHITKRKELSPMFRPTSR